jgi:RNA polymerase sigma-70 factor (sigma-E family)
VSSPDLDGFAEFVHARHGALRRTAYLLTGDHHDADDLLQVALAKCAPQWPKIAHRPEPYVRQVLARESISRWRRRRWREHATDQLPDRPARVVPSEMVDERLALQAALRQLAPRQRAVIVLRYYEDLTEREIASVLGISAGTVKSQARDGLARLRELVPDVDEPETAATADVALP